MISLRRGDYGRCKGISCAPVIFGNYVEVVLVVVVVTVLIQFVFEFDG